MAKSFNEHTPEFIQVVAAILYNERGECLLSSRPEGKKYAGYWEFAGGKVEQGETDLAALQREIHEELGITISTATPWLLKHHIYEHTAVRLRFFRIFPHQWSGQPTAKEGQQWQWQKPGNYTVSPMLPANTSLLEALTVPSRLSGSLKTGFQSPDGDYLVIPYAEHTDTNQNILTDASLLRKTTEKPPCRSLWAVADTAQDIQAALPADVWFWRIRNDTEAHNALNLLEKGLPQPLIPYAPSELHHRFKTDWLNAGAHTVIENTAD